MSDWLEERASDARAPLAPKPMLPPTVADTMQWSF